MTVGLSAAPAATKTCAKCGQDKPVDEFRYRQCLDCHRADCRERARIARAANPEAYRDAVRRYRAQEPERHRLYAVRKHLATMGLTVEEYDDLLASQGGRCAICRCGEPGGKGRWHVDHDHQCCGRKRACKKCIRGLLCTRCNVGLGYLGDNAATLLVAADYLIRQRSGQ